MYKIIKFLAIVLFLISTPTMAAQINITKSTHTLSYTDDNGNTKNYLIGVGKQGTNVNGVFTVEAKRLNPSWTPTSHMLKGRPSYTVPPGPKNPLGIAKLYLSGPQNFIGIHGSSNENSIGKNVSHGCIRLHREDILELYHDVPVGTKVIIK